jgi:outer membrane protein OmpA-like peptidoglycan-associated protein
MQALPRSSPDTAFANSTTSSDCGDRWLNAQEANMSTNDGTVRRSSPSVHASAPAEPHSSKSSVVLLVTLALFWTAGAAQAEDPVSSQQILNALTPKPVTRSLTGPATDDAQKQTHDQQEFVNSVRNKSTRSLTLDDRQQLATIAKDKPSIDIEIDFAYNSADIGRAAAQSVTALGQALSSPQLASSTFVLAGHTDAKGSDSFNQDLSERRAESVKQYLIKRYKLPAANLIAVGYGKTRLKNTNNPLAAENRRVQVINLVDQGSASK